jgi:methylated-DNA-[protein]-cysteine S-methyltransferase
MAYSYKVIDSPVGELKLVASDKRVAAILCENDDPKRVRLSALSKDPDNPILLETARQLGMYFAGKLKAFSVPLDFKGTEFQKSVWKALLTIPFGETRSYGEIARQIGKPTAFRAVGVANGKNPISIIAPCHRLIGSNGALTGFAGGVAAKERLLGLESGRLRRSRHEGRRRPRRTTDAVPDDWSIPHEKTTDSAERRDARTRPAVAILLHAGLPLQRDRQRPRHDQPARPS